MTVEGVATSHLGTAAAGDDEPHTPLDALYELETSVASLRQAKSPESPRWRSSRSIPDGRIERVEGPAEAIGLRAPRLAVVTPALIAVTGIVVGASPGLFRGGTEGSEDRPPITTLTTSEQLLEVLRPRLFNSTFE